MRDIFAMDIVGMLVWASKVGHYGDLRFCHALSGLVGIFWRLSIPYPSGCLCLCENGLNAVHRDIGEGWGNPRETSWPCEWTPVSFQNSKRDDRD